jgi:hypothetical protein
VIERKINSSSSSKACMREGGPCSLFVCILRRDVVLYFIYKNSTWQPLRRFERERERERNTSLCQVFSEDNIATFCQAFRGRERESYDEEKQRSQRFSWIGI